MLLPRLITALIALPIITVAIFAGKLWFLAAVSLVALIAGWEFGQMMRGGGYHPTLLIMLALIVLLLFNRSLPGPDLLSLIISVVLLFSLTWQLFQADSPTATADWALTLAGGLYIGWGMAHLVALRQLTDGLAWTWLVLFSTWGADTLAYSTGRLVGRHKLWPRHSPNKTWEGVIGGIGGGLLGAAIVTALSSSLDWGTTLIIGAIVPIVGLFGDLSISMMKRHVGVKDSSTLLPGHGGFLDRVDSILLVSVVVYYYALGMG